MAIIKIGEEENILSGSLIEELSFNDKTGMGTIKIDYYYLVSLMNKLMDRIPEESLNNQDSLGEIILRNLIIEYAQLTDKLREITTECEVEETIREAEEIIYKEGSYE